MFFIFSFACNIFGLFHINLIIIPLPFPLEIRSPSMHRLRNIFVISEGCIFSKYCSLSLFVEFSENKLLEPNVLDLIFNAFYRHIIPV